MADRELLERVLRLLQSGGDGFLTQLMAGLGGSSPAVSSTAVSGSGGRRSSRRARPPARLNYSAPAPAQPAGLAQGLRDDAPSQGAVREQAPPPLPASPPATDRAVSSVQKCLVR